jgi:hypothetical protein
VSGFGKDLPIHICQLADVNLAGLDGNYPLHHLLAKKDYYYSDSHVVSKLELINLIIDQNADVNQRNANGKCLLESLLGIYPSHIPSIIQVMPLLKAGASSTRLLSTGRTLFDLIDGKTGSQTHMKALLEADLAFNRQSQT